MTATIGMQLIQHQELKSLAVFHHTPIHFVEAREDVLQHHEVSEQDIGRVIRDGAAFRLAFLAGVALDGEGTKLWRIAMQKLVEFFQLAVGQSIHRIDDNGPGTCFAIGLLGLEYAVDDRDEKGQGLPRPRSGRDHIALAFLAFGQGFHLVLVKMQGFWRTFRLPDLEDLCAGSMQDPLCRQVLHRALALVIRVDLHQRLRPIATLRILMFDLGLDIRRSDANETAGKAAVSFDELVAELENVIHGESSLIHLVANRQNRCTTGCACCDALPFRASPLASRFDQPL